MQRPQRVAEASENLRLWVRLLDVLASLLAIPFASQRFFGALLFARLQIERVTFDLFDDVLLLDFALEAPQCAFERFAVLDMDFSQSKSPPLP